MRSSTVMASLAASLALLLPPAVALGGDQPPPPKAEAPFVRLSPEEAAALPSRAMSDAWAVALELPKLATSAKPARPGKRAVARVVVGGRGGRHVDPDYRPFFRPDPAATVTFAGERVMLEATRKTPCPGNPAVACEVELALPYRVGRAPTLVTGILSFSVCGAEGCQVRRASLAAKR